MQDIVTHASRSIAQPLRIVLAIVIKYWRALRCLESSNAVQTYDIQTLHSKLGHVTIFLRVFRRPRSRRVLLFLSKESVSHNKWDLL